MSNDENQSQRDRELAAIERGNAEFLAKPKPKRQITTHRAMDYRLPAEQGGGRWQRCSRCHSTRRLDNPVIYNLASRTTRPGEPDRTSTGLNPIMIGNELIGFICTDCFTRLCHHVLDLFPDRTGFPHVDSNSYLQPNPRCDECNSPLAYASDGRRVICPACDTEAPGGE